MNERIRKLAIQAHVKGNTLHYYNPEFIEKFAELIVQDCLGVLKKRYMGDNNREDMEVKRCIEDIKKHFGVE